MAMNLVGLDATQLILQFPTLVPHLGSLTFVTFTPYVGVENRLQVDSSTPIERRSASDLLESKPTNVLLDELLRHDPCPQRELSRVEANALSAVHVADIARKAPTGAAVGLCSIATLRNEKRKFHIPMLDFRVPPGIASLAALTEAVHRMGLKRGALLDSGRSYHFYGFDLLTKQEWLDFMARALLLAPLTDVRYVAHRLLEGMCILRLTATPLKPRVPTVVSCL